MCHGTCKWQQLSADSQKRHMSLGPYPTSLFPSRQKLCGSCSWFLWGVALWLHMLLLWELTRTHHICLWGFLDFETSAKNDSDLVVVAAQFSPAGSSTKAKPKSEKHRVFCWVPDLISAKFMASKTQKQSPSGGCSLWPGKTHTPGSFFEAQRVPSASGTAPCAWRSSSRARSSRPGMRARGLEFSDSEFSGDPGPTPTLQTPEFGHGPLSGGPWARTILPNLVFFVLFWGGG